jgi:hypothetical protein
MSTTAHPLIGKAVRYYRNGWRIGYLLEVKPRKKLAKIKPISTGMARNGVWVPLEGVEAAV